MPLQSSKMMLLAARREGYGVGAFNAYNMEMAQAIVEAAEEERAPVILQVSLGTIQHAGLEVAAALVKTLAARASVPVVLHLDHGTDFAVNIRCLKEGFTSLMYDGSESLLKAYREETGIKNPPFETVVEMVQSREAFEENVRVTRMVVEAAHACGVPVEAELGKIPRFEEFAESRNDPADAGKPGKKPYPGAGASGGRLPPETQARVARLCASPDRAAEFVELTGCDSLAAACGSVHGMKEDVQPLNLALVGEIASLTGIPLVLHGSSGVVRTREEARSRDLPLAPHEGSVVDGIACGIAKVNVSTELQATYLEAVREHLERSPAVKDVRKVFKFAREALTEKVRSYIRLFGSSGKA